jgi:Glycine-zipper domain
MGLRPIALVLGGAALGLAGCQAVPPTGPSFTALPGPGKSLQQFQAEDYNCRNYATGSMSNAPAAAQAATNNGVATAAGGTLLGAAAGALIGAAAGNAGAGAAIGAGTGLLFGTAAGANQVAGGTGGLQAEYNGLYAQCMVAAGNAVPQPGYGGYSGQGYQGYPMATPPVVIAPTVGVGFGYGYGYGGRRWGW